MQAHTAREERHKNAPPCRKWDDKGNKRGFGDEGRRDDSKRGRGRGSHGRDRYTWRRKQASDEDMANDVFSDSP